MKKILENKKIIISIAFIIYLLISLSLVLHHEIWTDEAQAWEIAKNLSIPEIFAQMKYEAHPCLWHLILAIPAKLGLPVISMNIISLICTSITVYIILFHSKFNLFLKMIIIFNPTFLYLLPVISRSYCLIALLLSIFSLIYKERKNRPILYATIIGLLSQTHIIICGFVGIAALIYLIELFKSKKYKYFKIALIIFCAFFILLALQLFPALKNCAFINKEPINIDYLVNKTLNASSGISYFFIKVLNSTLSIILLLLIFIIQTIITYNNNKYKGMILFISLLFFYVIHLFWPFTIGERSCLIFVLIVLLNTDNNKKSYLIYTTIISILIILTNYNQIIFDAKYEYSDSKNVGNFINKYIEDNSLIIIFDIDRHVSAIPYIKDSKKLIYYNIQNEAYQTFMTWNEKGFRQREYYEIENKINDIDKNFENVYILYGSSTFFNNFYDKNLYNLENNNLITKIYETIPNNIEHERLEFFKLYKFQKIF